MIIHWLLTMLSCIIMALFSYGVTLTYLIASEKEKKSFKVPEISKKLECGSVKDFVNDVITPNKFQVAFFSLDSYESQDIIKIAFANSKRKIVIVNLFEKQSVVCITDDFKDTSATFSFNIFDPESEL